MSQLSVLQSRVMSRLFSTSQSLVFISFLQVYVYIFFFFIFNSFLMSFLQSFSSLVIFCKASQAAVESWDLPVTTRYLQLFRPLTACPGSYCDHHEISTLNDQDSTSSRIVLQFWKLVLTSNYFINYHFIIFFRECQRSVRSACLLTFDKRLQPNDSQDGFDKLLLHAIVAWHALGHGCFRHDQRP